MNYPRDVYYRMRPGALAVLRELLLWEEGNKCPPTLQNLADQLGCTRQSIHYHFKRLLADGLIDKGGPGRYMTNQAGRKYLREIADETD